MKVLIIYSSIHHGNTEKVAKVLATSINADIIETKNLKIDILDEYDLIGFGSGIYYGKFHKNILNLIDKLPSLNNKKAFIFSTSGLGKTKYNVQIEKELKKHGFEIVESFACKGYDTFGPWRLFGGIAKGRPNDRDFQNAKKFAERLVSL